MFRSVCFYSRWQSDICTSQSFSLCFVMSSVSILADIFRGTCFARSLYYFCDCRPADFNNRACQNCAAVQPGSLNCDAFNGDDRPCVLAAGSRGVRVVACHSQNCSGDTRGGTHERIRRLRPVHERTLISSQCASVDGRRDGWCRDAFDGKKARVATNDMMTLNFE